MRNKYERWRSGSQGSSHIKPVVGTYSAGSLIAGISVVDDILRVGGHDLVGHLDRELVVVADINSAIILARDTGAVFTTLLPVFRFPAHGRPVSLFSQQSHQSVIRG